MFALIAFTFAVGTGLFIFAAVETSEAYGRHRRRKHAIEAAEERDLERFLAAMRGQHMTADGLALLIVSLSAAGVTYLIRKR